MALEFSAQMIKLSLLSMTSLSKDALHMHIGLLVFFAVALLLRRRLSSWLPWLAVLLVAIAGEVVDGMYDVQHYGGWRWQASMHDIINTLLWPTLIMLALKTSKLFDHN